MRLESVVQVPATVLFLDEIMNPEEVVQNHFKILESFRDTFAKINNLIEDGNDTTHINHVMVGIVNDELKYVPLRDTFTKHKAIKDDLRTLAAILSL